MGKKLFSTDGIRGKANHWPVTPEVAMKVAMAVGYVFGGSKEPRRVIIGKDTRLSGYMFETSMIAGFTAVGADVLIAGPIPTPAIAVLTKLLRCDAGVAISASHNQYQDNGIKIFGPNGYKLSDELECRIESLVETPPPDILAPAGYIGRARRMDGVDGRYIEFVKQTVRSGLNLSGIKVVLDCANGAGYRTAPAVLWELGADITKICANPNGLNINLGCGSTAPELLSAKVLEVGADIGVALDGDADRVVIVDEKGAVVDGDQILAMISKEFLDNGLLSGAGVVANVMSNLGLERYLRGFGLTLARTEKVGDRHIVAHMIRHGYNVGGEQSGHIVLSDHATTGDGLITALQVLSVLKRTGKVASEISKCFDPVPQILKNIPINDNLALDSDKIGCIVSKARKRLGGRGRLVVRPSGTEALVRVMAEGDDAALLSLVVDDIAEVISGTSRA